MGRLYNETGHASNDDRNQEAERLIDDLAKEVDVMAPREAEFVKKMDANKAGGVLFCTPRQLFWLRDLYEKYC